MATLYRRDNSPFWWLYYVVGGRKVRLSTGVRHDGRRTPCPLAREILGKHEERMARQKFGLTPMVSPKLLEPYFHEYLKGFKDRTQATQEKYSQITSNFLSWAKDKASTTADISAGTAAAYLQKRREIRSGKTVRDERNFLKSAWDEARRRGYTDFQENPWAIKVAVVKSDRRAFSPEEIKAMLTCEHRDHPWMRTMERLGLYTGARLDSVINLRWEFIGFEMNVINFDRSKTGAYAMALHPALKEYLLPMRRKAGLILPADLTDGRGNSDHGGQQFRYWLKVEAGVIGTFHMFRHTLSTALARSGVEKRIAMELVNHDDASVHEGYVHVEAASLLPHLSKVSFA
jgi:integrase